jgi:hypothetical protein
MNDTGLGMMYPFFVLVERERTNSRKEIHVKRNNEMDLFGGCCLSAQQTNVTLMFKKSISKLA